MMKRLLLIGMSALFVSPVWAGGPVPASAAGRLRQKDSIPAIRQRYAFINKSLSKYRVVKKELAGFSTEGGELVAYFDGPSIVKMSATYQGETGRAFEEFYYLNEKLIFVYRKQDAYDRPMSGKVVRSTVNRFYFGDGGLIRWIDADAKHVAPGNSEYAEKQTLYLGTSKLFAEGARSREPVIEAPGPNP